MEHCRTDVDRVGGIKFTSLMPNGPALVEHRRLIHGYVGSRESIRRIEIDETIEARRFLLRLLRDPSNFRQHIRT